MSSRAPSRRPATSASEPYWVSEAGPPGPAPALATATEADVVVLGGGYTGMWAAWHAKALEPEARVVLLETGLCGRGPSGRNGGFCNTMWHALPRMRDQWGDAGALEVARAAEDSVDAVFAFCDERGADVWAERGGYLQVSTSEAHDGVWRGAIEACRELGAPDAAIELSPEQVAERCRSPHFRGGALYPAAGTVQPARLAFCLREAIAGAGVELFERSPARRVRQRDGSVEVDAEGGSVRARRAVVAVGGAAGGRGWGAHNRVTLASSHIAITEPVPELLEEIGWSGGECITDSMPLVHYFRTTPDGRIAFGWGGGRIVFGTRLGGRTEDDPAVARQVVADLRATFPGLEGARIERTWGGPIDASPSHLPVIRPTGEGRILTAFGYTGNGVAPSQMVGRALASLALERRDEFSRLAFVDPAPHTVPPEPLRWLGGAAIRTALERSERAELAGRRPGPVSRTLAAIPGKIGFHIGR